MLAISLMRMGAKGKPFYRLVVKEKRSKRDGKYLENVGTYDPMQTPADVKLNHERIQYWISVGAQPTDTVRSLIKHNPIQTDEERAASLATRAEAKAAADQAKIDARKAAEAAKVEEARIAAEAAAAEKAEAEAAAAAEAAPAEEVTEDATEAVEAEAAAPEAEVAEAPAAEEVAEAAPEETPEA